MGYEPPRGQVHQNNYLLNPFSRNIKVIQEDNLADTMQSLPFIKVLLLIHENTTATLEKNILVQHFGSFAWN